VQEERDVRENVRGNFPGTQAGKTGTEHEMKPKLSTCDRL